MAWLTSLQEQFTGEWEQKVDPVSEAQSREDRVAGHYGSETNVWQVGMVSMPIRQPSRARRRND